MVVRDLTDPLRLRTTHIVAAAMAQRDRLRITWKQMEVDDGLAVLTAVQQTPMMLRANRDESQTPRPAEVGIGIALQTMRTILKPGLVAGGMSHREVEQPRPSLRTPQRLRRIAFVASHRGRPDTAARSGGLYG